MKSQSTLARFRVAQLGDVCAIFSNFSKTELTLNSFSRKHFFKGSEVNHRIVGMPKEYTDKIVGVMLKNMTNYSPLLCPLVCLTLQSIADPGATLDRSPAFQLLSRVAMPTTESFFTPRAFSLKYLPSELRSGGVSEPRSQACILTTSQIRNARFGPLVWEGAI